MSAVGMSHMGSSVVGHQTTAEYLSKSNYLSNDPLGYYNTDLPTIQNARKISRKETIHSGHYMVSEIDDNEAPEESVAPVSPVIESTSYGAMPVVEQPEKAAEYDIAPTCQETTQKYTYGPRSSQTVMIDASLSKLFECMSLAYSGTLTSPKWKSFKGLKLTLRDKIRLNNIIWRAWHMQCKSPPLNHDLYKLIKFLLWPYRHFWYYKAECLPIRNNG